MSAGGWSGAGEDAAAFATDALGLPQEFAMKEGRAHLREVRIGDEAAEVLGELRG